MSVSASVLEDMLSSAIAALDQIKMPTGLGWNGHAQHDWSTDKNIIGLQERFVQLYFQTVRPSHSVGGGKNHLKKLATEQKSLIDDCSKTDPEDHSGVMSCLRRLPLQTRDIDEGKGERDLAYNQVLVWYGFSPEFAQSVIRRWVTPVSEKEAPFGSWKDIKLFIQFICDTQSEGRKHPLIKFAIGLLVEQLRKDKDSEHPSLAAKWTPSEKCKRFNWIFKDIAKQMFLTEELWRIIVDNTTKRHLDGAYRSLRKMLTDIKKRLDVTEVKMCSKQFADIDFAHVPSITMQKNKRAFLNLPRENCKYKKYIKSASDTVRVDDDDRVTCAEHLKDHTTKAEHGEVEIKAKTTSLYDMVRDALKLYHSLSLSDDIERRVLEEQWKSNRLHNNTSGLPPMIPLVDVSGSMTVNKSIPLFYAIGLGLRAAEMTHPAFRNRIMTFTEEPRWVTLPEDATFVERVGKLSQAPWGGSTDFFKALKLILDQFVKNAITPDVAKGMVLAVFSDMQINEADRQTKSESMQSRIETMYREHGYEPPHILYWNLNGTDGFPSVTTKNNISMVSGFSPTLLKAFEEKGIDELSLYTPWRLVHEIMMKSRYD